MRILLSFIITVFFALNLQGQLNDYKYIVVPKRFDGFKKENQYQTSTLVKHLFANNGFSAVYDDALPSDLNANRCLGLTVRLDEKSSMFTTKTTLILEDCNDQAIFISQEGRSRIKDFKLSYKEAITEAFNSIAALGYTYVGESSDDTVILGFKNDVKNLEGEPSPEKNISTADRNQAVQQVATEEEQSFKSMEPEVSNYEKGVRQNSKEIEQVASPEVQSYKDNTPVASTTQKAPDTAAMTDEIDFSNVLYAQELENGYQLVDSTPKIVMTLTKTSLNDIYAAKSDAYNGIVFRRDGKWFFEYSAEGETVQRELEIKF